GLAPGQHALVVAGACRLRQLALELDLQPRRLELAQPRLTAHGALRRPELQHLAPTAQRLAHGPPPIHLLPHATGRLALPPARAKLRTKTAGLRVRLPLAPRSEVRRPEGVTRA